MSIYNATVPQFAKMLRNLDNWLTEAETYAATKKFDPNVFVTLRLAPDQFAFARQIQASCDNAKLAVARLTGDTAPSHPDTETTMAELRARIASTLTYVESKTAADFEGASDRTITLPFLKGMGCTGADYLNEFALPNFYFHTTTAYAILRHNGVGLGKMAFIGGMTLFPVPQA